MRWTCSSVFFVLAVVSPAVAQAPPAAPAHVAAVDGSATLNRDGRSEPVLVNMPIVANDRLRTTGGRVQILFPDGAALDLDQDSEIELTTEAALRLESGRALFRVPRARYEVTSYLLATPAASMSAARSGDYRLSYPDGFDSPHLDDFTAWVNSRQAPATPSASAQYLPANLQMYGPALDQFGGWQYDAAYGYVWYPTVASTWRPYHDGYWAPVSPYGWTWVGVDAWSWPTHHYGRWGYRHDRWFWIPARAWAPAWVAWGSSPDFVTWCPLGWDSRPVFSLSLAAADPWVGWTVLPRGSFGYTRVSVLHHAVHPRQLRLAPAAFALQGHAPGAVTREAAAESHSPRAEPRAIPGERADTVGPTGGFVAPGTAAASPGAPPANPPHGHAPRDKGRPGSHKGDPHHKG